MRMLDTNKVLAIVLAIGMVLSLAGPVQAGLRDDLVGYWAFDNSGSMGDDRSGNGYTGTLQDNAAFSADSVLGGGALSLDGANDYVQLPDMGVNFTDSASLSLWVKLNVHTPTDNSMTGFMDFDNGDNSHYTWSDGLFYCGLFRSGGRFNSISSAPGLQRDQWHLLTVVNDPVEGYKIYQNDTEIFSDVQPNFGIGNWRIGTQNGYWMNGTVDEVGLWNGALTQADVTSLYNGGSGYNFFTDGTLTSTGTAPSEYHLASCWTGDVPGGLPTANSLVIVDAHSVTVTTGLAEATDLQIINSGVVVVNTSQSLAADNIDASGGTLTIPSGATVSAGKTKTAGLGVVAGSILNVSQELTVDSAIDMTGVTLDVSSAAVKLVAGGTLTDTDIGGLSVPTLTADGGAMNLGGNGLTVTGTLNVTQAFNLSDPNLGAVDISGATVNLNGSTLTVNTAMSTDTLAYKGGAIGGAGSITPTNQYIIDNVAVSDNLSGSAELIVNGNSELSGNNTYAGKTLVSGGATLKVTDLDTNVGAGYLEIDNGYLAGAGTIARNVGTSDGEISFAGPFGFTADGADLAVTLNGGAALAWNTDFGGNTMMVNQTGSHTVEITNDINLDGQKSLNFENNTGTAEIAMKLSGNLTGSKLEVFRKDWNQLLWLSGSDNSALPAYRMHHAGIVRFVDEATGLGNLPANPAFGEIYYSQIETNGSFVLAGTTDLGNSTAGKICLNWGGGFSAYGAPLSVELTGDTPGSTFDLTLHSFWSGFGEMRLNSMYSDDVVTIKGNFTQGSEDHHNRVNWPIRIYNNPDSDADYARLESNWSMEGMRILGNGSQGTAELVAGYTIITDQTQAAAFGEFGIYDRAVFRLNGTLDASIGGNVIVAGESRLGGTGTVILSATTMLDVQGGAGVSPGASVGTLNVTTNGGTVQLVDNSIYEWEVGQPGETDTIDITGGTLDLDNFTLKIIDAEGYVANDTVELPVFTYSGTSVDMSGFDGLAERFDTSALGANGDVWSWGALTLTNSGGTIYLTGLSGGVLIRVPGDADNDGDVDLADLGIFESQFGGPPIGADSADFDNDGDVDLDDLAVMRDNYGYTSPTAPSAATPEPATMTLLAIGGLMALRRRSRKA